MKLEKNHHKVKINHSPDSTKKAIYPMSGILFDSNDNVFVGSSSVKRNKTYYFYFSKKTKKYYKKDLIDDIALNAILSLIEDDSMTSHITRLVNENLANNKNDDEKEVTELKKRLALVKTKKDRLLDAYLSADIEKGTYKNKKEELENEEFSINSKLRELDKVIFKSVSVDVIKNCFRHLAIKIKKEAESESSLQLLFRYFIKKAIINENADLITFSFAFSNEPQVAYKLSNGSPFIHLSATFTFSISPKLINISNCYLTSTV